jgi:hypothetical protein
MLHESHRYTLMVVKYVLSFLKLSVRVTQTHVSSIRCVPKSVWFRWEIWKTMKSTVTLLLEQKIPSKSKLRIDKLCSKFRRSSIWTNRLNEMNCIRRNFTVHTKVNRTGPFYKLRDNELDVLLTVFHYVSQWLNKLNTF